MVNTVIVKNSVVAAKRPAAAATNKPGELWANVTDGVIGSFDAAGAPVELGPKPGGLTMQFQFNSSGAFAGTPEVMWDATNHRLSIRKSPSDTTPGFFTNRDIVVSAATIGHGGGSVATNLAFGANALKANTTGANNVAIGPSALIANTTGGTNVAIGPEALKANQSGGSNVAIGNMALAANVSGAGIVAIGARALQASVNLSDNIAIGNSALDGLTSGNRNLAIGSTAGVLLANGLNNVAIGSSSLYNATDTTHNVAIGVEAMQGTPGNGLAAGSTGNIAIGPRAAFYLGGTSSRNIFIGHGAGNVVKNGSNNTIIGALSLPDNTSNVVSICAGGSERFGANAAGQVNIAGSGTAALPSIVNGNVAGTGANDATTGFWWPAAGRLAVSTGGVERMRWKDGAVNLVPLTTAAIKALAAPVKGDIAFASDANALCFYDGAAWQKCTATPL